MEQEMIMFLMSLMDRRLQKKVNAIIAMVVIGVTITAYLYQIGLFELIGDKFKKWRRRNEQCPKERVIDV